MGLHILSSLALAKAASAIADPSQGLLMICGQVPTVPMIIEGGDMSRKGDFKN